MGQTEATFKELRQIEAEQKKIWKQQEDQLRNQEINLNIQKEQLNQKIIQMNKQEKTQMTGQVNQSIHFAINSLPFWKRSKKNVLKLANEYFEEIEAETDRRLIIKIALQNKIENE